MDDDELRRQLALASEQFPVRGRPLDTQRRVVHRRRVIAGVAVVVSVAAVAGVAAVAAGFKSGPAGIEPPASTVGTEYVGSSWRLVNVTEGATVTVIAAGVGARLDLLPDGQVLVDTGVNVLNGRFTTSADGFEVHDVGTTLVLYDGSDPQRLTAIAALNTLAYGNREGVTPSGPARDKVVGADGARLVIQAGTFRLTFERIGPASTGRPDRPTASGKPT